MTSSFKDRFKGENHAILYRKYRPEASPLVINKILEFMKEKETSLFQYAVDIACGSGQSTEKLGEHFESVMGCDISEAQIDQAKKFNASPNIKYCVADALDLPLEDNSVDLVTCSEAAHWFDLPALFKEVDRVLRPSGCLAVYMRMFNGMLFPHEDEQISSRLCELHRNFRVDTLKGYWGVAIEQDEVIYNEDLVKAVTYQECQRHTVFEHKDMSLSDLLGYIESLSGYQKYHQDNPDDDILNTFQQKITQTLGTDKPPDEIILKTKCPMYLLLGRKPSSK